MRPLGGLVARGAGGAGGVGASPTGRGELPVGALDRGPLTTVEGRLERGEVEARGEQAEQDARAAAPVELADHAHLAGERLDTETAVVSIPKPAGWGLIAEVGSRDVGTLDEGSLPPRAQAQAILDAYLEAAKFKNDRVNAGYLNSLGLAAP